MVFTMDLDHSGSKINEEDNESEEKRRRWGEL